MGKNINHIQHIKSSVVVEGKPKLPQSGVLVEGELAINYADGYETISLENTSGEVVTFSSDDYYTEQKLGSGFTGANSANTVTSVIESNERVTAAALNDLEAKTEVIENNERVTAAALKELEANKLDISAYTPTDLSNYYTKDETSGKTEISNALGAKVNSSTFTAHTADTTIHLTSGDVKSQIDNRLGSGFTGENSANTVTNVIESNERVTAAALNDLESNKLDASAYTPTDLSNYYTKDETSGATELASAFNDKANKVSAFTDAEYNSDDKKIYFKNSYGTTIDEIDATDFIIDGMVEDVRIEDVEISGETVTCLVIDFNTASGKEDINIPISEIFDADAYYNKTDIDNKLGSGFTSSSVTEVIESNERVTAAALNDLEANKLDISAYTPTDLSDYYTKENIDDKLGELFTGEHSANTVTSVFGQFDTAVSRSLASINDRIDQVSADTMFVSGSGIGSAVLVGDSGQTATGNYSVAEGAETLASGDYSHAEGYYTITNNEAEHASGKFNVSSSASTTFGDSGNTLFSVGNGESSNRHNAFEIRQNGDIYIVSGGTDIKLQDHIGGGGSSITVDQVLDDTTSASTNPVSSKAVYDAVTDNELVWTNAYVTMSGAVSSHTENTNIHVTSADKTAWNAKVDSSDLDGYADSVKYNSTSHYVEFYHGTIAGTKVYEFDASDFIVDGMVDDVRIDDVAGSGTCLVVDFNTASGKQDINIPISDIFDATNYYNKTAIDDKLGSGFTSSSVTEVIESNERVTAAALNDLEANKLDASAYTPTDLSNYYTKSQTSGASEISTALGLKVNVSDVVSAITSENSASTAPVSVCVVADNEIVVASALNDLKANKLDASAFTEVDVSGYTSSGVTTNSVSYDSYGRITNAAPIIYSAITISAAQNNVVCPDEITGASKSGAQAIVIYVNGSTTTDYDIAISTSSGYVWPNGTALTVKCPKSGYCEISYLNVGGVIYVRGI